MNKDLRSRNEYFSKESISVYFKEYSDALSPALNSINPTQLGLAHRALQATTGTVFVGGNGGSAAISDHLCCDFTKGVHTEKCPPFQVHSLVGSMALFSALGNDIGYEETFSYQLKLNSFSENDVLILISSSGNSDNIVRACRYAQGAGGTVIGLTGFDGGQLNTLADIKLHVNFNNYGVVEDCHQILMHVIAQYHYVANA